MVPPAAFPGGRRPEGGRVELLCVGTELLSGKNNTHTAYFAEALRGLGLSLARETTLPDDPREMRSAISEALRRSEIVLVCGGLGPTFDDLTREAVAGALGRRLVFKPALYREIRKRYLRFHRRIPDENRKQAEVVQGARSLKNLFGSAPGQILSLSSRTLVLLPGPMGELKPIFERDVLLALRHRHAPGLSVRTLVLHLTGIAESAADERLRPLLRRGASNMSFTILAGPDSVDLHATASHADPALAEYALDKVRRAVQAEFGSRFFGLDGETLESAVGRLLTTRKATLSVAESATGGLVADKLTNVPGSSAYFLGGVVAYSNAVKTAQLGVRLKTLDRFGAVSARCAKEMALGVRRKTGSDYSLALTGIAGPSGGTRSKPVGLTYIAAASPNGTVRVGRFRFPGGRRNVKERSASAALDFLRLLLAGGRKAGRKE